jgi:putative transcriptional regulator
LKKVIQKGVLELKNKNGRNQKEISKSIITGLKQALSYSKGKKVTGLKAHVQILAQAPTYKGNQIKSIRHKHNLTQNMFALTLGVSKKTVEAWEANRNVPQGPAQRVLFLLDKKPGVLKALG